MVLPHNFSVQHYDRCCVQCEFYHLMRLDKQTCDWHNKKCNSLYVTQDISKGARQAAGNAVALIRVKNNPVATNNVASRIFRLLATFGDAIRMTTEARRIEEFSLSNNVVSPSHLYTGKRCKTSKPPRFTKSGQEPPIRHESCQTTAVNALDCPLPCEIRS